MKFFLSSLLLSVLKGLIIVVVMKQAIYCIFTTLPNWLIIIFIEYTPVFLAQLIQVPTFFR